MGIRGKLIVLFVFIKVLPLIALGWVAWEEAKLSGQDPGVARNGTGWHGGQSGDRSRPKRHYYRLG